MKPLWVLTRMEILRVARTREVFLYLVLPSLLWIPTVLFFATLLLSLRGSLGTVAIPPDLSPPLGIQARLEKANLKVLIREDPYASWEKGEADAAVVRLVPEDGIGAATVSEPLVREAWRLELVGDTTRVVNQVQRQIEEAAREQLDAWVFLSGGKENDAVVVSMELEKFEEDSKFPLDVGRGLAAYTLLLLGLVSFFFLALPQVADRREGWVETFRVMPVSPMYFLWARLLSILALQLCCGALIAANIWMLMASALQAIPLPSPWLLISGVGALVLVNAFYLCVGVVAPTAKLANNVSSGPMTLQVLLLLAGAAKQVPYWGAVAPPYLPIGGALVVEGPVTCLVSLTASIGMAIVLVSVCGHLLQTRVSLVLKKGDE